MRQGVCASHGQVEGSEGDLRALFRGKMKRNPLFPNLFGVKCCTIQK